MLAVLLEHLGDHPLAVGDGADVALVHADAVGRGRDERVRRRLVARVARGDRRSLREQRLADRQPDPPGTAGHERDLALQAFTHAAPFA